MSKQTFENPIGFHLIKIGEPIEVYGHDLKITREGGYMMLLTYDKRDKEHYISSATGSTIKHHGDMEILVNSDDYVKLGWPSTFTPEAMSEQETAKLRFIDCRGLKERHDSFSRPLTILR